MIVKVVVIALEGVPCASCGQPAEFVAFDNDHCTIVHESVKKSHRHRPVECVIQWPTTGTK